MHIFYPDLKTSKSGIQVLRSWRRSLESGRICLSFLSSSPNHRIKWRLTQCLIELLFGELDSPLGLILFVNVFNGHLRVDCV